MTRICSSKWNELLPFTTNREKQFLLYLPSFLTTYSIGVFYLLFYLLWTDLLDRSHHHYLSADFPICLFVSFWLFAVFARSTRVQVYFAVDSFDVCSSFSSTLFPNRYISICMYRSFFRLKIPFVGTYTLFRHHSDVYALCFNAYYICRLQFSLCYHYFTLLQVFYDFPPFWWFNRFLTIFILIVNYIMYSMIERLYE